MDINNNLYLSITYYNDPKQTIYRKIHTSILGASTPLKLHCKVNECKYRDYEPIHNDVFILDFENNVIIPLTKDYLEPPNDKQIEDMQNICNYLGRAFNMPKTKVEASTWIAYYMNKYNIKINDTLDNDKTPPTEKQINYIKGICEVLEIEYKEPKTKGEATVWLNHFVPFYKRKCEENELDWEANNSDLMDNYGDWSD